MANNLSNEIDAFECDVCKDRDTADFVENNKKCGYEFSKRLFDIVCSILALIVLSPLFLIISVAIYIDDKGSVMYKHQRVGKNGKPLYIYKFRSMKEEKVDLEKVLTPEQLEQYKIEFKIDNDPRITRVGNFLRKTSLDELPQLINILKGELSLIGPRPVVQEETLFYGENRDLFLSIKPGLTGYWQAYARNNVGYADGTRQNMELYYIKNRNWMLDIKILFKTVQTVLTRKGAQ